MIQVTYMRNNKPNPNTIPGGDLFINQYYPNRIWMASSFTITDQKSGFKLIGAQFMLLQLLFFLNVKIQHPHLTMEYI